MTEVLVVDDDAGMRTALQAGLRQRGWNVEAAGGAREAVIRFQQRQYPLVISDVRMPDGDGFALMNELRCLRPQTAVILLTAFASVPDAVDAMKAGAFDYLMKPVSVDQLERTASRVLSKAGTLSPGDAQPLGDSRLWRDALDQARRAAATDADILIEAESGTGKEVLARFVHQQSARRTKPLVALNCAAFPESLLESELFGHTRGAFTGAAAAKPGKFELANGGTLLLDEIGEMPLRLQPKLLRVLQEREFDRLGDTRSIRVDVRIIATTNRSLEEMIQKGEFRADLYYRLNVIPLQIPPLRSRRDDIAQLAEHFVTLYSPPGRQATITAQLLTRLQVYDWPGNVRELANLMRRLVALAPSGVLGVEALAGSPLSRIATPSQLDRLQPGLSLEAVEKRLVELTLAATQGNRSRAAEMLGVSLRTVRNKVRDYGLPRRDSYNE